MAEKIVKTNKIEETQYSKLPISAEASPFVTSAQSALLTRIMFPAVSGDHISYVGKVSTAAQDPVSRRYFDHSLDGFDLQIVGDQRYWNRRNPELAMDRVGTPMMFTVVARANSTPGQGRYLNGRVRKYDGPNEADLECIRNGSHCPMGEQFQVRITNTNTGETRRVQVLVTSSRAISKIAELEASAASPVTE